MKKLPLGIQSIEKILANNDYVYVDKTGFIKQLIDAGSPHYFMSRPRRFGKSLFVSTLEEIFKGNKELFKGLEIYNSNYQWKPYPVLHFDFSLIANQSPEALRAGLHDVLDDISAQYHLSISGSSLQSRLTRLVRALAEQGSQVVVLVDEYDKPIINNLSSLNTAEKNRDLLGDFFGALKGLDAQIKFTFITGVSKFSQVSIFSGLNNLKDITMVDSYADMLGYTEEDLHRYFQSHIHSILQKRNKSGQKITYEEILDEIRVWYNGYRFSKATTSVYNPFSTLNYMESGEPKAYWYRTGTPSFLTGEMSKHPRYLAPLSGTTASENSLLDISSLDSIDLKALMFQTGYLTVQGFSGNDLYHLGFPNKEVEQAFFQSLTTCFAKIDPAASTVYIESLEKQNISDFLKKLGSFFASFPYHLFAKASEATYQGMLLALLKGMGLSASAEYATNLGRIDVVIETEKITYIFECKLDKSAAEALTQIEDRKYYQQYIQTGKEIGLVGVNFSSKDRNISEWKGRLLASSGELLREL